MYSLFDVIASCFITVIVCFVFYVIKSKRDWQHIMQAIRIVRQFGYSNPDYYSFISDSGRVLALVGVRHGCRPEVYKFDESENYCRRTLLYTPYKHLPVQIDKTLEEFLADLD